MRPMLSWTVIVACLVMGQGALFAQKIGYVSTEAIRSKFEPNKTAEGRLDAAVAEWKAELSTKQKNIDELELEFKKNRLIWTDQERQQQEKELDEKRRERDSYAREKFEPNGAHDKLAEELFGAIWNKIYVAVQRVAAAEGYDMVWDKTTQPLVYVNPKYDITVKVMKELGIDSEDMEKKQKEAIDSDPRNKRTQEPRRRKSRSRSGDTETAPEGEFPSDPNRQPPSNTQLPELVPPPKVAPPPSQSDTTKLPPADTSGGKP